MQCVLLLSVAANKPAHEHNSANLIKLVQHEVMSADRAAVVLMQMRRKTGRRSKTTVPHFLLGTFAEQIYPQLSAAVEFQSQRKRELFGARVWMPKAVSSWSWVGCVVECGSEIVERFGSTAEGKVMMTQVETKGR